MQGEESSVNNRYPCLIALCRTTQVSTEIIDYRLLIDLLVESVPKIFGLVEGETDLGQRSVTDVDRHAAFTEDRMRGCDVVRADGNREAV